jgi:nucleotide-binding universal stress UspA family protein
MTAEKKDDFRVLVATDFSSCSKQALKKAADFFADRKTSIIVLHVLDQRFLEECISHKLAEEGNLKRQLFMETKRKLDELITEACINEHRLIPLVCEGIPYKEINRQAKIYDVDVIFMGSYGMAGDPEAIFFGGTTEKVLRFISRPVICIPPGET